MSDTTKIVLAVLGFGTLLIAVAVISSNSSTPAPATDGFTPAPPGAALPAQDAGAEAVRGGFTFAGQLATIFATARENDRRREAESNTAGGGKSGDDSGFFSWTEADRTRSAADLAAKNGTR